MKLVNFRKTPGNWWRFNLDGTRQEYYDARFQLTRGIPEMQLATHGVDQEFRVYRTKSNRQTLLDTFADAQRCLEIIEGQLTMF